MQNLRFFICVTLFLALSGSGAAEILDYKTLCIKCVDEKSFPECPSNEISNRLNLTIYCQRLRDNYCTLGILNEAAEDVFSTDVICRLNQIGRDLGGVLREDENNFKIVSIMEEPLKPLPLLLLSTMSTISNKMTTDFDSPAAEIDQNTIENGKPTAGTLKNINATVNLSTEAENHSTKADKTKRETVKPVTGTVNHTGVKTITETVKPVTEPTTDTVTPTKDTVKLLAETVKPITEDVKSSTEAVKTAETSVKPPNNDAGHIEILSITQNAVEPSKPDISHMAIVANPDTMAALEDGTNSGDAAAGAEEAEKPAEAPETSPEAPETPLVAPETPQPPADAPEPPAEEPVAPAEASDAPAEAHETPAETPDAPAETPEAPAESPEAPSEAHMATTETPDAAADTPEAPGPEEPNADKEDKDSNKEPMDYQGDEGKPDGDIDADAPPKPLDKPNDVPEKVPGNPSAAGNKPTQAPIKCFTCTTLSNSNCTMRPDKEIDCPAVETGKNVQNGCYTMFNAVTNVTSRGCISDMTPESMKYCKDHIKYCQLCHEQGCNHHSSSVANFLTRLSLGQVISIVLAVLFVNNV